tara:strand:- start:51 stop:251 length:201 start_codon:yes stop_codon:yes gene_type:complete
MIKKIINKIKELFTPKEQEMDEHAELYLKVPEPEIPVHKEPEEWTCDTHNRYKKSCPVCREIKGTS